MYYLIKEKHLQFSKVKMNMNDQTSAVSIPLKTLHDSSNIILYRV